MGFCTGSIKISGKYVMNIPEILRFPIEYTKNFEKNRYNYSLFLKFPVLAPNFQYHPSNFKFVRLNCKFQKNWKWCRLFICDRGVSSLSGECQVKCSLLSLNFKVWNSGGHLCYPSYSP